MASIYEISNEYQQLMTMADDPDIDENFFMDTWEAIDGEFEIKAENYAKVMQNITSQVNGLKAEIERLTNRKKAMENSVDRMKRTLQYAMEATEKPKFKTDLFSFNIQKNPASVVMDEQYIENIPEKYLKYAEPTIDKAKIKEDLNAGIDLGGIAHLEQGQSLRIR